MFGLSNDSDAALALGSDIYFYEIQINLNDNAWRHAVWTMDRTGYWQVYLNGVLIAYLEAKIYPISLPRAQNYLGKGNFANEPYLNGAIDEFYMFKYMLSTTQIQQLYSDGTCEIRCTLHCC